MRKYKPEYRAWVILTKDILKLIYAGSCLLIGLYVVRELHNIAIMEMLQAEHLAEIASVLRGQST